MMSDQAPQIKQPPGMLPRRCLDTHSCVASSRGPSMKSDVFVMTMDTEKWAKWSDNMVDGDGKNWKSFPGAVQPTATPSPSPG